MFKGIPRQKKKVLENQKTLFAFQKDSKEQENAKI